MPTNFIRNRVGIRIPLTDGELGGIRRKMGILHICSVRELLEDRLFVAPAKIAPPNGSWRHYEIRREVYFETLFHLPRGERGGYARSVLLEWLGNGV